MSFEGRLYTNVNLYRVAFGETPHVSFWEETIGEQGQKDKFWKSE